jgi:hypothetical protein
MGLPASDPARIFGIGLKAMRAQLRESQAEPETDEEREARFAAQADAQVQAKFAAARALEEPLHVDVETSHGKGSSNS